jgi:hypothetical protein
VREKGIPLVRVSLSNTHSGSYRRASYGVRQIGCAYLHDAMDGDGYLCRDGALHMKILEQQATMAEVVRTVWHKTSTGFIRHRPARMRPSPSFSSSLESVTRMHRTPRPTNADDLYRWGRFCPAASRSIFGGLISFQASRDCTDQLCILFPAILDAP